MTTEIDKGENPPQIRNNKVTQISKGCTNCRHVAVCSMFKDMEAIITMWNNNNPDVKFPFKTEILAQTCPHYESPLDVIKLADQMSEARNL